MVLGNLAAKAGEPIDRHGVAAGHAVGQVDTVVDLIPDPCTTPARGR